MDERFEAVLTRYAAREAAEAVLWRTGDPGALFARRDDFLLSVGEASARFLHSCAVGRGARRLVELGTSYGYSTLFLADAARRTGGRLQTFELSADKQAFARAQIADAGLADHVEWLCGDAVALLDDIEDGVDFVLIDLWKDLYVPCLDRIYPKLADTAILAADNMLHPVAVREDADRYRQAVRATGDMQSVLLPIGSGIELSCLWRAGAV